MRNDFESNYLMHHGILGQKWGKKNGPPYPLGASDHSASEKKAGWKKSLGGGRNEEEYQKPSKLKQFKNRLNTKEFREAQQEYARQKYAHEDSKLESEKMHRNAKLAKENPYISKYSSKMYEDWEKNYNINMARSEAVCKRLVDKYGEKALASGMTSFDKQRMKMLAFQREEFEKEKESDVVQKMKKAHEVEQSYNTIKADQKGISKSMANDMVSDIRRWQKEDGYKLPKEYSSKTDKQLKEIIQKEVYDRITELEKDGISKFGDDTINFNISGLEAYSDYQPLTVDYDIKNKKVKNFYYL